MEINATLLKIIVEKICTSYKNMYLCAAKFIVICISTLRVAWLIGMLIVK